ncbi:hypothetical protein TNCV_3580461 [Trichonephila clavipes]|nr:hypothetical protein TNCV_3580461 [Trichonephila clavipes]
MISVEKKNSLLTGTQIATDIHEKSPDLNRIDHLWDLLECKIRQHNISSKDMLKSVLKDEWEKISAEEATKLVHSMPKQLQEIFERRDYPTNFK